MDDYISRQKMISELRGGFFPQDVVYTEAVEIAKQIIESAPVEDVVPRSEIAKIFEEIDVLTRYFHIPNGCAVVSLERIAELKKKYGVEQT